MSNSAAPNGPFEKIRSELDRWLEAARITGERALDAVGLAAETRPLPPHTDIIETASDLHILVDLPGVVAEAVDLSMTGQMLTLKAIRLPSPLLTEEATIHLRERLTTRFERTYPLPFAVDTDSVTAVVRDGTLHIILKKTAHSQARQIPIQRGDESPA